MGKRCPSTCPRVSSWSSRRCGNVSAILLNELAAPGKSHVLDAVFISSGNSTQNRAVQAMQQAADDMEDLGFNLNDRRAGDELGKVVGYTFVPRPAQRRVPSDKWALTHASLLLLEGQRKVDIELLRDLVGVCIWEALLNRAVLSIPHAIFRFMEKCEGLYLDWWLSARKEVTAMADSLIYLCLQRTLWVRRSKIMVGMRWWLRGQSQL